MPATRNQRKIFVLDTSVILYDSSAINNFEEHDVVVPLTVLEELDQFKKGSHVINLHAREFIRQLDRLSVKGDLKSWIRLDGASKGRLRVVTDTGGAAEIAERFGARRNDHRILAAALEVLEKERSRQVILVTKDINLRVKARALALAAEDYETVRIRDVDHLYSGTSQVEVDDDALIDRLFATGALAVEEVVGGTPPPHCYFILRGPSKSALAVHHLGEKQLLRVSKETAYGVVPRNAEQTFALHAVMNPEVPLVSLAGAAGTGKTLLALAGALAQRRRYRQIYLARPIVPLSNRDIGFLPGDVKSKVNPFMQPLWDNLQVIRNQFGERQRELQAIDDMLEQEKLHIVPLAYIRGRSLSHVIFIVDEAQNLTPHEVKTIITRAGEGTKIVFTGDVYQIDTPYMDSTTNGLSYLIDRIHGNPLYAHVNLVKGERSELANLASELL